VRTAKKVPTMAGRNLPRYITWVFLAHTLLAAVWAAEIPVQDETSQPLIEEHGQTEIMWELDPYYSNVSANIPLTSKPIPTITSDNEAVIYQELIKGSLIPRYMLFEASVYPLPVLGTHLKRRSPDLYSRGRIEGTNVNLIDSVTAGFQEPWAVSVFLAISRNWYARARPAPAVTWAIPDIC